MAHVDARRFEDLVSADALRGVWRMPARTGPSPPVAMDDRIWPPKSAAVLELTR